MSSKTRYKQDDLEKDAHEMHGAFVWFIILIGVGFSDFIYFQMVSTMFSKDDPLMQGIAFAGAITTALSVLLLYHGKKKIFRPGKQVWTAWAFTVIEIGVMIANDILFFAQKNGGSPDSFLAFWKVFCPAAPVISVAGWLLISYFDPSRALLHVKMSKSDSLARSETHMQAEIEQSEIDFKLAMHRSRMDAKYAALEDMQRHLAKAIQYEVQEDLRLGAGDMGRDIASSLTNTPISQLSRPRKVVDADPPQLAAPALAASKDQVLDPGQVKPEVDAEKKKSLGDKLWGIRDAIDAKFDGRKDESPVEQSQEEKPIEDKQPKLPSDPSKWSHKHWMIAKDTLPWREYKKIFDEYRGDEPEKEYEVLDDKPILEERHGHDPRTRRLGGDHPLKSQEDLEDNENPQ